jgi:hypothetical protein
MKRSESLLARIALLATVPTIACQHREDTHADTQRAAPAAVVASRGNAVERRAPPSCAPTDANRSIGDTLLFSDLSKSEETGDVSGAEFALTRDTTGTWRGTVRLARGQLGEARPLDSLVIDSIGGAIHLQYSRGGSGAPALVDGRIVCDSIYGRWTPFPNDVVAHKTYWRVGHSGAQSPLASR